MLRLQPTLLRMTGIALRDQTDHHNELLYEGECLLFAIAMMANPVGWLEVSNLPEEYVAQMKPLVTTWKAERVRMHGGTIVPIGTAPDGVAWTGFASTASDGKGGYVLLFRELNEGADFSAELPLRGATSRAKVIGGRGTARIDHDRLAVNVPDRLDFIWGKFD